MRTAASPWVRVPKSIVVGVAVSWPVGGAATLAEARTVATNAAAASETRNFTRIPTTPPVRGGRVVSQPLPELLDAKHLAAELGVTRAAAEAIMRQLPTVQFEGQGYSRRGGVRRLLEERTFTKNQAVA